MNERKRVPFTFLPVDYKAAQRWLEEQAAEGWELMKAGAWFAVLERTNRRDLRYCADLTPGRDDRDYLALCREAGWERASRVGYVSFFKSRPGTRPAPLQTDGALEQKLFSRTFFRGQWPVYLLVPLMAVIAGVMISAAVDEQWRIYDLFFSRTTLMYAIMVLLALLALGYVAFLLAYWVRGRRRVAAGGLLPAPSLRGARVRSILLQGVQAAVILLCILSYAGLFTEDTTHWTEDGKVLSRQSSLLGSHLSGDASPDYSGWILFDDFDCRTSWLAGLVERDLLAQEGEEEPRMGHLHDGPLPLEEAELGFDRAWLASAPPTYEGGEPIQYLIVRQGNRVLRLCGDMDFTEEDVLEEIRQSLTENTGG